MAVVTIPNEVREEMLRSLIAQYKSELMRLSTACLKDPTLAEDAVQETFVKAYKAMDAFRGDSSEKTWLMRIAINTCRDMRRDKWYRFVNRAVALDDLQLQAEDDRDRTLMESVMNLPYREKEVVLLYYYEGMRQQEIAEVLGTAVSTVSERLKKARARLLKELEGGRSHA